MVPNSIYCLCDTVTTCGVLLNGYCGSFESITFFQLSCYKQTFSTLWIYNVGSIKNTLQWTKQAPVVKIMNKNLIRRGNNHSAGVLLEKWALHHTTVQMLPCSSALLTKKLKAYARENACKYAAPNNLGLWWFTGSQVQNVGVCGGHDHYQVMGAHK